MHSTPGSRDPSGWPGAAGRPSAFLASRQRLGDEVHAIYAKKSFDHNVEMAHSPEIKARMFAMPIFAFDAVIDLLPQHLERAGLPAHLRSEALHAVRLAVNAMPGASDVDIVFQDFNDAQAQALAESHCISLYEPEQFEEPEGAEWTMLRLDIAEVIAVALETAAALVPDRSPTSTRAPLKSWP